MICSVSPKPPASSGSGYSQEPSAWALSARLDYKSYVVWVVFKGCSTYHLNVASPLVDEQFTMIFQINAGIIIEIVITLGDRTEYGNSLIWYIESELSMG